jgi:hypothetical protein
MVPVRGFAAAFAFAGFGFAAPPTLSAQLSAESQLRDAVVSSLQALNAGDLDSYYSHFVPDAHVVLQQEEGGGRVEFSAGDFPGALSKLTWAPTEVVTQVVGTTAVTVVEVAGAITSPAGGTLVGLWRYTELRTLEGGAWRIAQVDLTPRPSSEPPVTIVGSAAPAPAASPAPAREPAAAPAPTTAPPPAGTLAPTRGAPTAPRTGSTSAAPITATEAAPSPPDVPAAPVPSTASVSAEQAEVTTLPPGAPPAPVWPEVISRDDQGNATVRAVRLTTSLDVDGRLDEPIYTQVPAISGFIQSIPEEGVPATELTEAWITFDDENVYVSARVHEEVPESEWTANEMRRDSNQVGNNDNFGLIFDTYYDRRNGYFFYTNPLGAMIDVQVTNEGSPNFDWNPVWDVRTGRFEGGWTVEMRFPFKSFRYQPGTQQVWGLNLRRSIRRKNEWSHLTAVSRAAAGATGRNGIMRLSRAATLVGIEAPPMGLRLDVKPYGIGRMTTVAPDVENDFDGDGGLDARWGIAQNLALDLTYNTDFAQVEVDEQQVNLTRFNLQFPEKRDFFLESRGIFDFPAGTAGGGGGGSSGGGGGNAPALFYSRRIGLQDGRPVPILGGGRLTGKFGPIGFGAVNVQTEELTEVGAAGDTAFAADETNFSAVRLRADILNRSSVGAIFTRRSQSLVADGWTHTYGADGSFSFFEDLYLIGYYAVTETEGREDPDRLGESYQARVNYNADLEGVSATYLVVEEDFNPEVGFLRRSGFTQTQASIRRSPRPSFWGIRQINMDASADYVEREGGEYVESRDFVANFGLEFVNDQTNVTYTNSYERLVEDERIGGVTIPAGRYPFSQVQASYMFGTQRFISGTVTARHGSFYDGHLTSASVDRGRVEVTPWLSLEPSVSVNWLDTPREYRVTTLALTRVNFTFSPRMYLSTLVQYNSGNDSFSANARFRWEWAPGSEIFVVYTEERGTFDFERFGELSNRGLVLKVTRLLRL